MFYDFSKTKYDKVFFIDDLLENCEQINTVLTDNNINIKTYHIASNFKELEYAQIKKNNSIQPTIIKQQQYFHTKHECLLEQRPYLHTKCETLVEQPVNNIVVVDPVF